MPAIRAIGLFFAISIALALFACSDEPDAPTANAAAEAVADGSTTVADAGSKDSRPPVIHDIHFDPAVLAPGRAIRAIVRADDPDGEPVYLSFEWQMNGVPVPANGASVTIAELARGDSLRVTVQAKDPSGAATRQSARIHMNNRPPRLLGLDLEREKGPRGAEGWRAVPQAEDPDQDELEYSYEWVVNGRVRGKEEWFSKKQLRRGDEVMVRVTASDDEASSSPLASAPVTIGNKSPDIVSTPPGLDSSGAFIYQMEVEDPDGDRSFVYSLAKGPEGMEVSKFDGTVEWRPTADQVGRHPVELVVDDRNGGESKQIFHLAVFVNEEEASPASR